MIFAAMLFVAGIHWKYIFMAAGSAVALCPLSGSLLWMKTSECGCG